MGGVSLQIQVLGGGVQALGLLQANQLIRASPGVWEALGWTRSTQRTLVQQESSTSFAGHGVKL